MKNTAFFTVSANRELFEISSKRFPSNVLCFWVDGSRGFYGYDAIKFAVAHLRKKYLNIRYLFLIDEDIFILDQNLINKCIDILKQSDKSILGVRDGGDICHRHHNPYVPNTFFTLIDIDRIFHKGNLRNILSQMDSSSLDESKKYSLEQMDYPYDVDSTFEPYYKFFFWILNQGHEIEFVNVKNHKDGVSTLVFAYNEPLLVHTWYARGYKKDLQQTQRIDSIVREFPYSYENSKPTFIQLNVPFSFYVIRKLKELFKLS